MQTTSTQELIENMTNAFLGVDATTRQKYLFEQTLLSLVRLAKAEQRLEIKASVKKLTTPLSAEALSQPNALPRE
jgi:hypothetical protein